MEVPAGMGNTQGVFMDEQVVPDLAKALGGTTLGWLVCLKLSYRFQLREAKEPNVPVEPVTTQARLDAADKLLSTPFYVIIAALAIKGTLGLRGDLHTRWHGTSPTSRWAIMLYVSRMAMDIPIQQISLANDRTRLVQMTAHHLLSAMAMGGGLVTGRMHYFGLLDLCCEITTIFLNSIFSLKTLSPPSPAQNGKIAGLGIGLFLSFIAFRITLFPYWLYQFRVDVQKNPKDTWDAILKFERYFYPSINVFLFALSSIWMVPITTGVIKAIGAALRGKPKVEEAKKAS